MEIDDKIRACQDVCYWSETEWEELQKFANGYMTIPLIEGEWFWCRKHYKKEQ